jgi:hypothetical protein
MDDMIDLGRSGLGHGQTLTSAGSGAA